MENTREKQRFVDLHCDTIVCEVMRSQGEKKLRHNPEGHLDLERLKAGGSLLQCLALYIPVVSQKCDFVSREFEAERTKGRTENWFVKQMEECGSATPDPWVFFTEAADWFEREVAANADMIRQVKKFEDIEKNAAEGIISALMTVEDGVPLEGDISRVDEMFARGVRMLTLTWNHENTLGFPNKHDPERGLKPFGLEALSRMNELGIIADVSHLSDAGFWDVANNTKKPFVASHSNAKALCPIYRNLTDDMLRAIAKKGGVTGLNFSADFLVDDSNYTYVKDLVRHARYIADVAGAETIALGSDFDGISCTMEFHDCGGFPMIEEGLNSAFTAREVDMITHGNALRVMKDNF